MQLRERAKKLTILDIKHMKKEERI